MHCCHRDLSAHHSQARHLTLGAAAGLAGTLALQAIRLVSQKWLPSTIPPMREDPGDFMTRQAQRALPARAARNVPEQARKATGMALGIGYGMTFGVLYAAVRPEGGCPVTEGAALGLTCWAAGYLGWLPATGVMPPIHRQSPLQAMSPALRHIVYGMATVAIYDLLDEHL